MINSTNSTSEDDEATCDRITDPDAKPGLPPRQPSDNHGRRNHPSVDVEGISDPETDKVPGTPLTACGFDWFEIVVGEHKLGVGETRLRLDCELVGPSRGAGGWLSRPCVHFCEV